MKTVRILATMFVAVLSLGFVACSDDDDEDGKKEVKVNFEEFILSNYADVKAKLDVEPVYEDEEGADFVFGDEVKYVSKAEFWFAGENLAISVMKLTLKPEVKEESVLHYLDTKYYKVALGSTFFYSDVVEWLEANFTIDYSKDDETGITLMYLNEKIDPWS